MNTQVPLLPVSGGANIAAQTVNTLQTNGNTGTYQDLATVGPQVTLTTGTSAMVWISAHGYGDIQWTELSVEVEYLGSVVVPASDANGVICQLITQFVPMPLYRVFKITGLTAGLNTFRLKYKSPAFWSMQFFNRGILVQAL